MTPGFDVLKDLYVRTSSVDSVGDGERVRVGFFDADGLRVRSGWDDGRDSDLGVSAARKF
ncbi:hypothetical protein [uncultured Hyphomicrobium sp.]|uniref:hypothetical protein n=1 Tax=uncultured Hyphomicrobium sp. TaxID=194373 RepID=UPI0025F21FDF|nr:hypothetical protein [uncultured Hyphomicrobium sp.]